MNSAVLYLITVLVWGSTWFAIEFQLGVVAPEVSIVYRYAGASLLLFGWCALTGRSLAFPLRQHVWFALLGALLFGINYVFAYRAQVHITSALTAILFSTMLWLNIVNARLFFGTRAGREVIAGAVLGVIGIVALFAPQIGELSFSDGTLIGSLLAITSALVASFGNMASQAAQKAKLPIIQSNAWGMFYGAVITAVIAATQGHAFNFDVSTAYIVSLAYLTVFGSIIAFGAYLTLLGRIGAHRAGYAMVAFPVVALILSVAFEGLKIDLPMLFGICCVLSGNLLVLAKGSSRRRTPAEEATRPGESRLADPRSAPVETAARGP